MKLVQYLLPLVAYFIAIVSVSNRYGAPAGWALVAVLVALQGIEDAVNKR